MMGVQSVVIGLRPHSKEGVNREWANSSGGSRAYRVSFQLQCVSTGFIKFTFEYQKHIQ
jgi:hypothetical protein